MSFNRLTKWSVPFSSLKCAIFIILLITFVAGGSLHLEVWVNSLNYSVLCFAFDPQVCPPASPEREATSAVPLPACGLHRWRLSAWGGGAEVLAWFPQDHRWPPGQSPRVPASLAATYLLCTATEQGHHETLYRYVSQICLLVSWNHPVRSLFSVCLKAAGCCIVKIGALQS